MKEKEKGSGSETSFSKDFISKWQSNRTHKRKAGGLISIRTLIFVLVLLLICMYLLESKYIT